MMLKISITVILSLLLSSIDLCLCQNPQPLVYGNFFYDDVCSQPVTTTGQASYYENTCTILYNSLAAINVQSCSLNTGSMSVFYYANQCSSKPDFINVPTNECYKFDEENLWVKFSCAASNSNNNTNSGASGAILGWIRADGKVLSSTSFLNVTHISSGHYCVNVKGNAAYNPVLVTINSASGVPGVATANTGWGDSCNGISDISVMTYSLTGFPTDFAFSIAIGLVNTQAPPPNEEWELEL